MLVDSVEIKISEKEALKSLVEKIPLLSKVIQFNKKINGINLRYIEYKILKYKVDKIENGFLKSDYRIIILNTYTGHTKLVDEVPATVKRYIASSCVEKSKIDDYFFKNNIRNEIERRYRKYESENIVLSDVFSIYKPYWSCSYNGKNIFLEA